MNDQIFGKNINSDYCKNVLQENCSIYIMTALAQIFCFKCGTKNQTTYNYCFKCGTKLQAASGASQQVHISNTTVVSLVSISNKKSKQYIKPGTYYKIRNYNFTAFVDNWGNPKQGTVVRLAARDNPSNESSYKNQLWMFKKTIYDGYYKIENYNTGCYLDNWSCGKCPNHGLEVRLAKYDNPSNAYNYSNQLWRVIPSAMNGYFKIESSNFGCFLDNWSAGQHPIQGQALKLAKIDNPSGTYNYSNQLFQLIEA